MITKQDFRAYVLDVLREVEDELTRRRAGVDGTGTLEELEQSVDELSSLVNQLEMDQLPPVAERELVSAWFALHTWPAQDQLGERICKISQIYKRLLEEPDMAGQKSVSNESDKSWKSKANSLSSHGVAAIQGNEEV